jgi:hypothetical protein
MEMNRPPCGRGATVTRTFGGFNAVADCPRTRIGYGHGLFTTADWTRTRIVHGHRLGADGHCSATATVMDWLRTRMRAWPGYGHGLDVGTTVARMRTVFGLDAVADWTPPRPAGRAMARTFRVQTATTSRTQKPSLAKE